MPPITTIAPINRHRLILYSFVVIAPITASNIPVTKMRQEMTACFCGLLFFIWSRSFVRFRIVDFSIPRFFSTEKIPKPKCPRRARVHSSGGRFLCAGSFTFYASRCSTISRLSRPTRQSRNAPRFCKLSRKSAMPRSVIPPSAGK